MIGTLLAALLAAQTSAAPPEPVGPPALPPALPSVRPDPVPSVLILEIGDGGRVIDPGRGVVRNREIEYEGQDARFAAFAEAIEAAPDIVRRGYAEFSFPFSGQRWREVLACRAPDGILGDAAPERVCFVCSIDDIGGARFGEDRAPVTAVSIRSAYGFFGRDERGRWRLRAYEPFGGNRYARNGTLRHRASTRWIAEAAVGECYDLQSVNGRLNIY